MWEISGRYYLISFPLSRLSLTLLDFYARPHSYKWNVLAAHTRRDIGEHNSAKVDLIQSGTTIHTVQAPKLTANNLLIVITHFGTTNAPTGGECQYDRTFWALQCICSRVTRVVNNNRLGVSERLSQGTQRRLQSGFTQQATLVYTNRNSIEITKIASGCLTNSMTESVSKSL